MIDLHRLERLARRVRLRTVAKAAGATAGQRDGHHRAHGVSFDGHREYGYGDDVRHLDWNVTARLGRPFVKVFRQERSGTVVVLVDASGSMSADEGRDGMAQAREAAAFVALLAALSAERVGLGLFTDRLEWWHAPRRGRAPALAAIRHIEAFGPVRRGTSFARATAAVRTLLHHPSTIVVLSDFIDPLCAPALATLRREHRMLAVCLHGRRPSARLRGLGLVRTRDAESVRQRWIDTDARWLSSADAVHEVLCQRRRACLAALDIPVIELPVGLRSAATLNRLGMLL